MKKMPFFANQRRVFVSVVADTVAIYKVAMVSGQGITGMVP